MPILLISSLKRNRLSSTQPRLQCLFSILFFLSTFNLSAQDFDESNNLARFSIETGVYFPSSNNFETTFNTNAAMNWRLGLDFGNKKWKLYPWVKFSTYQFSDTLVTTTPTIVNDSIQFGQELTALSIRLNQFSIGLAIPIKFNNNNELILRFAVSENRHRINNEYLQEDKLGLFMSMGYLHRLNKNTDFTFDLSHNYNKNTLNTTLRDWSGFSLNMGIAFNIL